MRTTKASEPLSRRAFLTAATGAALGAVAAPLLARSHTEGGYDLPGSAADRGLGLVPRLQCTAGTRSRTAGPFFTPASPLRDSLREPGTTGALLVLQGLVLNRDCRPLAGAVLDIWHADEHGRYDNRGFRYRGHQFTDRSGAFRFETIRPGDYPSRTPHIHVKVQGPDTALLTTQIFFPDRATANARDSIYREDLLVDLTRTVDGWLGRFDFVLAPARVT